MGVEFTVSTNPSRLHKLCGALSEGVEELGRVFLRGVPRNLLGERVSQRAKEVDLMTGQFMYKGFFSFPLLVRLPQQAIELSVGSTRERLLQGREDVPEEMALLLVRARAGRIVGRDEA